MRVVVSRVWVFAMRCGMVWCGVVMHVRVACLRAWHACMMCMARHGMAWYGVVRHGVTWRAHGLVNGDVCTRMLTCLHYNSMRLVHMQITLVKRFPPDNLGVQMLGNQIINVTPGNPRICFTCSAVMCDQGRPFRRAGGLAAKAGVEVCAHLGMVGHAPQTMFTRASDEAGPSR